MHPPSSRSSCLVLWSWPQAPAVEEEGSSVLLIFIVKGKGLRHKPPTSHLNSRHHTHRHRDLLCLPFAAATLGRIYTLFNGWCDECVMCWLMGHLVACIHGLIKTPEMQQRRTRSSVCVTCQGTEALIHVAVHRSWHRHLDVDEQ